MTKETNDDSPLLNKNKDNRPCYCGCPDCGKVHSHTPIAKIETTKYGLLEILSSNLVCLLRFEYSIQRDDSLLKIQGFKDYTREKIQNIINISEVFADNFITDKKEIYISLCMDCYELRNILNLPNPNKSLVLRLVRDIQNSCIQYFDLNIYN